MEAALGGPDRIKCFYIDNLPRLHFVFERADLLPPRCTDLREGRIWAYYERDDKEHLAFINKVWRICAKMTTNVFDGFDNQTGKRTHRAIRTEIWAGPDTVRWCRGHHRRRIAGGLRPPK